MSHPARDDDPTTDKDEFVSTDHKHPTVTITLVDAKYLEVDHDSDSGIVINDVENTADANPNTPGIEVTPIFEVKLTYSEELTISPIPNEDVTAAAFKGDFNTSGSVTVASVTVVPNNAKEYLAVITYTKATADAYPVEIVLTVPKNTFTSRAGRGVYKGQSNEETTKVFTVIESIKMKDKTDIDGPGMTIESNPESGTALGADGNVAFTFKFQEGLGTGSAAFTLGDVQIENGRADDFGGSGRVYRLVVIPDNPTQPVKVKVPMGAVKDTSNNPNEEKLWAFLPKQNFEYRKGTMINLGAGPSMFIFPGEPEPKIVPIIGLELGYGFSERMLIFLSANSLMPRIGLGCKWYFKDNNRFYTIADIGRGGFESEEIYYKYWAMTGGLGCQWTKNVLVEFHASFTSYSTDTPYYTLNDPYTIQFNLMIRGTLYGRIF